MRQILLWIKIVCYQPILAIDLPLLLAWLLLTLECNPPKKKFFFACVPLMWAKWPDCSLFHVLYCYFAFRKSSMALLAFLREAHDLQARTGEVYPSSAPCVGWPMPLYVSGAGFRVLEMLSPSKEVPFPVHFCVWRFANGCIIIRCANVPAFKFFC